jgi:hypothetical protein
MILERSDLPSERVMNPAHAVILAFHQLALNAHVESRLPISRVWMYLFYMHTSSQWPIFAPMGLARLRRDLAMDFPSN